MTWLPNAVTTIRMIGAAGLLLCDAESVVFWALYLICGISDMADGYLARRLKCVSKTGARLDSVADICFVVCCAWQLLPVLDLPRWLWLWAGVIVAVKLVSQVLALAMYGCCYFPHTLTNKLTGLLLFITIPTTFWTVIPLAAVAVVATYAAIDEALLIRTTQKYEA